MRNRLQALNMSIVFELYRVEFQRTAVHMCLKESCICRTLTQTYFWLGSCPRFCLLPLSNLTGIMWGCCSLSPSYWQVSIRVFPKNSHCSHQVSYLPLQAWWNLCESKQKKFQKFEDAALCSITCDTSLYKHHWNSTVSVPVSSSIVFHVSKYFYCAILHFKAPGLPKGCQHVWLKMYFFFISAWIDSEGPELRMDSTSD